MKATDPFDHFGLTQKQEKRNGLKRDVTRYARLEGKKTPVKKYEKKPLMFKETMRYRSLYFTSITFTFDSILEQVGFLNTTSTLICRKRVRIM